MIIVFFSRLFYPHVGGVEKHVMEISKRLIAKGHTIIVITEKSGKESKDKEIYSGMTIYRISCCPDGKLKKFHIWQELWKLRNVLRSADIIHCHDVFFWYLPFRFLFSRKRVYTTFHGYEGYPISKNAILLRKISEKLSYGNICIGDYIKKWYGTKPTYISYGAVESAKGISVSKKPKKDSAIFIGRLDEQTGILEYVKAVKLLKKNYPTFDFLVIGDGKYRKIIDKKIKMLGFQRDPEKYFPHFHFAFVSRYLVSLEAMLAKRLVFAIYDNPLKADCFKLSPFYKWIILVENEIALTEKVEYYLEHPVEEKKIVDEAYQWVRTQTWDKLTRLYLKLWNMH